MLYGQKNENTGNVYWKDVHARMEKEKINERSL